MQRKYAFAPCTIMGHELTHGFDDEVRKFDSIGNMIDWWTPEDLKKFQAKTGCLVKQYGNFVAVDDIAHAGDSYAPEVMRRLREVKRAWDPENIFHRNVVALT